MRCWFTIWRRGKCVRKLRICGLNIAPNLVLFQPSTNSMERRQDISLLHIAIFVCTQEVRSCPFSYFSITILQIVYYITYAYAFVMETNFEAKKSWKSTKKNAGICSQICEFSTLAILSSMIAMEELRRIYCYASRNQSRKILWESCRECAWSFHVHTNVQVRSTKSISQINKEIDWDTSISEILS